MCGLQVGLLIIPLIPIGCACTEGCAFWAHYQLQFGERCTMPALCAKPSASRLADRARTRGSPARQAGSVIWHPAILEATSSGLRLSKSALHLQPAAAGTTQRGSFARSTMPSHPCKSTEARVVWGSVKLATREELEGRERYKIKICGQETNQKLCQTKVTYFLTAIPQCLKAPLQYLYSLSVVDGS